MAGGDCSELCTVQWPIARRTASTRASVVLEGSCTSMAILATRQGGVSLIAHVRTHRRSLPAGAQAATGVMGDARRQGCDEEIGGCRACVLAARLPRLVDDHFMTAHRDPVAVTAEADDC